MTPEGLRQDVKSLFSLRIPNAVWEKMKTFQDREFVRFVDECLSHGSVAERVESAKRPEPNVV